MRPRKNRVLRAWVAGALLVWFVTMTRLAEAQNARPRARDIGVAPGVFLPGSRNAITDVQGVTVGHVTGTNVGEGSVGAGTGTIAFGWKGGIGTSSPVFISGRPGFGPR